LILTDSVCGVELTPEDEALFCQSLLLKRRHTALQALDVENFLLVPVR
jgi:hypothetical protein